MDRLWKRGGRHCKGSKKVNKYGIYLCFYGTSPEIWDFIQRPEYVSDEEEV